MKRILAAIDSSETSATVVARAIELARGTGAKVRLLRAVSVQPLAVPSGTFGAPIAVRPSEKVDEATASLTSTLEGVPEDLRDGIAVEVGSAPDVICATARAYDAEVVVIGAHRYGVLERVLGTTAARVVNRIDRPVFVVRPPEPPLEQISRASRMKHPGSTRLDAPRRGTATATLRCEHAFFERAYAALVDAYRAGDWNAVRKQWDVFEAALRTHMDLEEKRILPLFRRHDAEEADALLAEHEEFRTMLGMLGIGIDLRSISHDAIATFVGRLRAHSAREELVLYPWVDWELDADAVQRGDDAVRAS
jgi:nucleotide-binding universal stress UspA family protein/hemerythrin-like domain-containing protein